MPWIGAAIGAGSALAGTIGNMISSSNANAANSAIAQANNATQLEIAQKNIDMQREFAQMGVQWRMQDARAAGIHPAVAMGAQTSSFSPVSVGLSAPNIQPTDFSGLGRMGQDVGRAVEATLAKNDKMNAVREALSINRMGLENELIQSQINRNNQQGGPPFPSWSGPGTFGSGNVQTNNDSTGSYKLEPAEVTTSQPGQPGHTAGPNIPQVVWAASPDGRGMQSFPPKGLGVEDEFGAPLMTDWYMRNRLGPNFNADNAPPMSVVQKHFPGAIGVRFDRTEQRWVPTYRSISDAEIRGSIHGPNYPDRYSGRLQRGAYIGPYK